MIRRDLLHDCWLGRHSLYGDVLAACSPFKGTGPIRLYFLEDRTCADFDRPSVLSKLVGAQGEGDVARITERALTQLDSIESALPGVLRKPRELPEPIEPKEPSPGAGGSANRGRDRPGPGRGTVPGEVAPSSEAERARIEAFAAGRGITRLCHFTRIENVESILQMGLCSRASLERQKVDFRFNDDQRLDGHRDAICLSIQFPNWKMLSSLRWRMKNTIWAVLFVAPSVLWEKPCSFYPENAAKRGSTRTPLWKIRGADALRRLYSDVVPGLRGPVNRAELRIEHACPTNPQAEVLVHEPIPAAAISSVVVQLRADLECLPIPKGIGPNFAVSPEYFRPRSDEDGITWKKCDDVRQPPPFEDYFEDAES